MNELIAGKEDHAKTLLSQKYVSELSCGDFGVNFNPVTIMVLEYY